MAYPNSSTTFNIKINKNASGYAVGPEYFNVPSSSPYELYLDHIPKSSATTVIGASGGAAWTEVVVTPTVVSTYLLNYTSGKVQFYSGNSGVAVQATYQCLGDDIMAEHVNLLQDEITAIETELGSLPKGSRSSVTDRFNIMQAELDTKSALASGITGQWLTDNTVRSGALMSDVKGATWGVTRDTLTDISTHKNNGTSAHAASAISCTSPGATTFATVQAHISAVGGGTQTDTNPHGITMADLGTGDITVENIRARKNLTTYNFMVGNTAASGNYIPTASGTQQVGTDSVPVASGNFGVLKADTGYITSINVTSVVGANAANGVVVLDGSRKLPAVDGSQLTNIASAFVPSDIQLFTSSGTWTKPAGVSKVYVKCWGSGGGGGAGASSVGGGGGGGAYAEGYVTVTGNVTVTVGDAGAAGNHADGTDGAACSFGTDVVAGGGAKGLSNGTGGAGGIATAGTIQISGAAGAKAGGSSPFGGTGGDGSTANTVHGISGGFPGGGGGSGQYGDTSVGGGGSKGAVYVYY